MYKYNIGDRLVCIKDYYSVFIVGGERYEYETALSINHIYTVVYVDDMVFQVANNFGIDEVFSVNKYVRNTWFITLSESRKQKLERLRYV